MRAGGWVSARRRITAVRGAAVRRTRRATAVRSTTAARSANRMLAGFAVLAGLFVLAASRVHVNASWSDDAWGYLLLPMGAPSKGDVVIFDPPDALGAAAPYLKRVLGMPGDAVSVDSVGRVSVGGSGAGLAKQFALDGRPLDEIEPGAIPPGHYYLHGDHADSHDSRYAEIGLVPLERILGRAAALPDLPWLGLQGPLVEPPRSEPGIGTPMLEREPAP